MVLILPPTHQNCASALSWATYVESASLILLPMSGLRYPIQPIYFIKVYLLPIVQMPMIG